MLRKVPPDIIRVTSQLGMVIDMPLGSGPNVVVVMELLDIIESTQFLSLSYSCRECWHRSIDYHPGSVNEVPGVLFHDRYELLKIDQNTTTNRTSASRVVPN